MSDNISRADAIRWVKTECNPYGKPTLDYDSGLKVIEHLKKMPSELPSAEIPTKSTNTPSNTPTDIISRADAIEAVLTYFIPRSHTGERGEHEEDFVRTIFKALPSAEAVQIHNDGTLEVKVANAQKVGRVLVMDTDSHIGGGLFYPDDAVEVVRCRDCKHKYVSGNGTTQYYVCDFMDAQYEDDGFCHHGESEVEE